MKLIVLPTFLLPDRKEQLDYTLTFQFVRFTICLAVSSDISELAELNKLKYLLAWLSPRNTGQAVTSAFPLHF